MVTENELAELTDFYRVFNGSIKLSWAAYKHLPINIKRELPFKEYVKLSEMADWHLYQK